MKASLLASLFSFVFLIIQTTWLKDGLAFGVIPDFALLVIVWVSYHNKKGEGSAAAFISGLACDALSSSPLGSFAFVYVIPAYFSSLVRNIIAMDRILVPAGMGAAATLIKALASHVLVILFGSSLLKAYSFAEAHVWIESLMNGLLAPLVFLALGSMKTLFISRKAGEQ